MFEAVCAWVVQFKPTLLATVQALYSRGRHKGSSIYLILNFYIQKSHVRVQCTLKFPMMFTFKFHVHIILHYAEI